MDVRTFTKKVRRTTYAAIDPSRPMLSCEAKTVYIIGAGLGSIGSGIALSFAKAGAAKIGLFGRTATTLEATKAKIEETNPGTQVHIEVMDISSNQSTGSAAHNVRVTLGAWDVFVNGAAHLPKLTTIAGSDDEDWFRTFEGSIKFIQYWGTHFLPKSRPNATYISLSAGAVAMSPAAVPLNSAYTAMKVASVKLDEYIALENPDMRVFTLDPGIVDTRMYRKFAETFEGIPDAPDHISLPSDYCVWLASRQADFLRGRYLSVNFDVDELITRKNEFEEDGSLLKLRILGFSAGS